MALSYKPPKPISRVIDKLSVFLAGTIDMGNSEDWQTQVTSRLDDSIVVFNPRRDDWDSSWKQEIENKQFYEQVSWELNALEQADIILFVFLAGSQSPITLMELGLHAGKSNCLVVCPEGYWRKANVDIVCKKYGVTQTDTIEKAIDIINAVATKRKI